jgi:SAM-dependent methyltransferase
LEVVYGGDRMWPTVPHGTRLDVTPRGDGPVVRGEVVVASVDSVPDLLRVAGPAGEGRLRLCADADSGATVTLGRDAILARAALPNRDVRNTIRFLRRLRLDLREAWCEGPSGPAEADPAESVRAKYDLQAPFYAEVRGEEIDADVLSRMREIVPPPSRVLVVGSGAGRESFALAREGFRVRGIDFSPAMIEQARRGAREHDLDVRFDEGDVRSHRMEPGSLDGILFTFDVFSFLPGSGPRIALLRRMRDWLTPGGVVFLSARRVRRLYERAILTTQWIRRPRGGLGWGASHTRYLEPDGTLSRSFVHYFTLRRLRRETARAGFRIGAWHGGHVMLSPGTR